MVSVPPHLVLTEGLATPGNELLGRGSLGTVLRGVLSARNAEGVVMEQPCAVKVGAMPLLPRATHPYADTAESFGWVTLSFDAGADHSPGAALAA